MKSNPNKGFQRSATEQALVNLEAALRALELVPVLPSDLTPHPSVIVKAEIHNAIRSLVAAPVT